MKRYCIVPKNQEHFWAMIDKKNLTLEEYGLLKQARVKHVEIDPEAAMWEIILSTPEKIPTKLLDEMTRQLKLKCNLKQVYFEQSVLLFEDYLIANWKSLIEKVADGDPTVRHLLLEAKRNFDGCTLTLEFQTKLALEILKTRAIEHALKDALGAECFSAYNVIFITSDEMQPDAPSVEALMTPEYRQALREPIPSAAPAQEKPAGGEYNGRTSYGGNANSGRSNRNSVTDPGMIVGRAIHGAPVELRTVLREMDNVTIEGQICQIEERELRTKRYLLTFDIGDGTDGISCKMFIQNKEKLDAILKQIENGMALKVKGSAKFDTFSNELCLFIDSMTKAKVFSRMDTAEEKRVELHAHTHMSDMDSVLSIKRLIQTAAKWGHKAVSVTDHGVVQAFLEANKIARKAKIKLIYGMEGYLVEDGQDLKKAHHIILLARTPVGIRNLYRIVSISHLKYLYKSRPRIPRKIISEYREGLIVGSACEAGELIRGIVAQKDEDTLLKIASFYDYLEVQPTGNNAFMIRSEREEYAHIKTEEDLQQINIKVAELADRLHKPLVATCDVHFLNPEDEIYRRILMTGKGFKDADFQPPLYLRTTEEMLAEFQHLGAEKAYEAVVTNSRRIEAMIEDFAPICDEEKLYSPQIPGAEEQIRTMSYKKARAQYGENLPKIVLERLEMELRSIIGHGYAVLYLIAHKLVKKSLDDGYLVGSRGSVGSSFVANMTDITEVNSLPPHWRCPHCKYSKFIEDGSCGCGFDLPDKNCPYCGSSMIKDGHNIPFAVFMGFNGDKVPDIDLNFSGDYQPIAHKYTEELFGKDNVFKAGTIGTVADKTAFGYIRKYFDEKQIPVRNAYINTLVSGCAGVKRTTGQHPGGIMVIPRNIDVHYFTPIQHPANDKETPIITTHFDYHAISGRLVKLDILGHDDPTVIKMLENLTGIDPKTIPFDDPATMRLFSSTDALCVLPEDLGSQTGTYGIPEFGTNFVRKMLDDTKPKTFSELVRISGFSHGTDVWLNNAQDLIRSGTAKVSETISARDDIMNYLIQQGVQPLLSFKIMENVRKGRGIAPEVVEKLKEANVPDWYIDSCQKIKYLFPKAHAVAYVMMAYRIAYCKVHYPLAFYAAYFTVRADAFDAELIVRGKETISNKLRDLEMQGTKISVKDKGLQTVLEIALEMYLRGYTLERVNLYESDASNFIIHENSLLPPLGALEGVGETAAKSIVEARAEGEFKSIQDLKTRTTISKTTVEVLREIGCLKGLPETAQIELFG